MNDERQGEMDLDKGVEDGVGAGQEGQEGAQSTTGQEGDKGTSQTTGDGDKAAQASSDDWRAAITDDKVRKFAETHASPADLAKWGLEARQKLSNAVTVPGKNASDEDRAAFNKALGVPETPDGYEITLPEALGEASEADKAIMAAFKAKMHEAGAPPAVVAAAGEWYGETVTAILEAQEKALTEAKETAEAALRKEWGKDFDRNVEISERFVAQFFSGNDVTKGEDLLSLELKGGGLLGAHPDFLRLTAAAGRGMTEAYPEVMMSDETQASLKEQVATLTKEAHDLGAKGDIAGRDRKFAERDKVSRQLYGDKAA